MNKRQHAALRAKLNANQAAATQWCKDNKTNGIPSEVWKKFPFAKVATNENRSKVETYEFLNDPPENYFLYIREEDRVATTFMGDKLGSVSFGSPFKGNFGDVRVPITVLGINGRTYHGTYYKSAGDYARIKASNKK